MEKLTEGMVEKVKDHLDFESCSFSNDFDGNQVDLTTNPES